jgi:AraC family transcriptional regulator
MSVLALGQMFGRVPRRWGARSLMLSPVIHEHRRLNDAHAHEAAFVTLMVDGEYGETAARRSFSYDRFSAVYHPPQLEHRDAIGAPGVRLVMFEFAPELVDDISHPQLRSMRDLTGTHAAWQLLSLYRDASDAHDDLDFESRALQVIADVVRTPSTIPIDRPAISRARDFVNEHFRDRITMSEIAGAADLHPVYLGQMFHRHSGETIGSYVARLRVRAAAETICSTSMPFAEIALDHGFCDQSHFNRVFKRVSGFTPAAFRSQFTVRASSTLRANRSIDR